MCLMSAVQILLPKCCILLHALQPILFKYRSPVLAAKSREETAAATCCAPRFLPKGAASIPKPERMPKTASELPCTSSACLHSACMCNRGIFMNIYKLTPEPNAASVPMHTASHLSERTQPDDSCIIHILPSPPSACHCLSSPSFSSATPGDGHSRKPIDFQ